MTSAPRRPTHLLLHVARILQGSHGLPHTGACTASPSQTSAAGPWGPRLLRPVTAMADTRLVRCPAAFAAQCRTRSRAGRTGPSATGCRQVRTTALPSERPSRQLPGCRSGTGVPGKPLPLPRQSARGGGRPVGSACKQPAGRPHQERAPRGGPGCMPAVSSGSETPGVTRSKTSSRARPHRPAAASRASAAMAAAHTTAVWAVTVTSASREAPPRSRAWSPRPGAGEVPGQNGRHPGRAPGERADVTGKVAAADRGHGQRGHSYPMPWPVSLVATARLPPCVLAAVQDSDLLDGRHVAAERPLRHLPFVPVLSVCRTPM